VRLLEIAPRAGDAISLRLLAVVAIIASYAAAPVIGRWVTTANASTVSAASSPDGVYSPANDDNDNAGEDCNTGNPRKDKKCNYNQPKDDNSNDNFINDGSSDPTPRSAIAVNSPDPGHGDTISFTVYGTGTDLDQLKWWLSNYNANDNDNDSSFGNGDTHYAGCDGNNSCQQTVSLNAGNSGTFTIHSTVRDRQGRESSEAVSDVHVR
jgi:hypothetical protein